MFLIPILWDDLWGQWQQEGEGDNNGHKWANKWSEGAQISPSAHKQAQTCMNKQKHRRNGGCTCTCKPQWHWHQWPAGKGAVVGAMPRTNEGASESGSSSRSINPLPPIYIYCIFFKIFKIFFQAPPINLIGTHVTPQKLQCGVYPIPMTGTVLVGTGTV